jgi:hypothetical protein
LIIDDPFDIGSANYSGGIVVPSDSLNYSSVDYYSGPSNDTMIIDHIHDVEREEETTNKPVSGAPEMPDLQSLFLYTSTNYSPSSSGAIGTIDFKLDYRTSDPFSDFAFHVRNGFGNGATDNRGSVFNNDGQWHTLELLGLNAADFNNLIDFENSASLQFGFSLLSSAFVDPDGTDPVTYQVEVDNFEVTVNPVPEPSSMLLLGSGLTALAFRRWRSSAV